MDVEKTFAQFFKPETKNSGQDIFAKGAVHVSVGSDTQIQAFVKSGTPAKVNFMAPSIASQEFTAKCSCSAGQKGQLCKHIWATIMAVAQKHPDFLDSKSQVAAPAPGVKTVSAYQLKQKEFRKEYQQKQKIRAKEQRLQKKNKRGEAAPLYSPQVSQALHYFATNGFPIENHDEEELKLAKKKLSRVFHPDVGGSHDEISALNANYEIVLKHLRSQAV